MAATAQHGNAEHSDEIVMSEIEMTSDDEDWTNRFPCDQINKEAGLATWRAQFLG